MGLLSRSISVQELKNPWLKSLGLERRGREPGERATGERWEALAGRVIFYRRKKKERRG